MKSHRTISRMVALLLALGGAVPVSASATSLLSGYGGPGQGNQALLGSALLPGGPSGSGGGPAGSGAATASAGAGNVPATGAKASGTSRSRAHRHAATKGKQAGGAESASESARRAYQAYVRAASSRPAAADSVLGLSGSDFLYVLLALAALLFTALITRGLGRGEGATRAHG
jgi:hypothetical protein